jgi:hypothetical protein
MSRCEHCQREITLSHGWWRDDRGNAWCTPEPERPRVHHPVVEP